MGRRQTNIPGIFARLAVALGSVTLVVLGTYLLLIAPSIPPVNPSQTRAIHVSGATIELENGSLQATNDVAYVWVEETTSIDVLGNDTASEGSVLTIASITQPNAGVASISPDATYVIYQGPEWTGTAEFTYTVTDDSSGEASAKVMVAVNRNSGAGSIAGRVTKEEGEPIYGVRASASGEFCCANGIGITDVDGFYEVPGLAPESYCLGFNAPGTNYLTEYYDNRPDCYSAHYVDVADEPVAGINAQLETGAIIRGRVTDESGNPIEDIAVSAGGGGWHFVTTNAEGNYEILGLRPGQYTVYFHQSYLGSSWKNYLPEWYDDKSHWSSADTITLSAKEIREEINASLAAGGRITGRVSDESGNPIEGVYVTAQEIACCGYGFSSGTTDADGNYELVALRTASYQVSFQAPYDSNYLEECFNDRPCGSGDEVAVQAGQTRSDINAALSVGAIVSGRVTDDKGEPIEGIQVNAHTSCEYCFSKGSFTDSEGNYSIKGIPTGNYKIKFGPSWWSDINFFPEWYDDRSDFASADTLSLTAGQTTRGIDAQLNPGGVIEGQVQNESGTPVQYVSVSATNSSGRGVAWSYTDKNGNYRIPRLPYGQYRLKFSPRYDSPYVEQWFDGKTDQASADPIWLNPGESVTGINATLVTGAVISGKVTDMSGNSLSGIDVSIFPANGNPIAYNYTTARGTYRVRGLPEGTYKVRFGSNYSNYLEQWWKDKPNQSQADSITLSAKETRDDINAVMRLGGIISGKVTDENGEPLQGAGVQASSTVDGTGGYGYTDASGNYQISRLRGGTFKVSFYPPYGSGYVGEWYDDKPNQATADVVTVTEGSNTEGIDAALSKGGKITGRVTDIYGGGIQSVTVSARDALGGYFYGGWTDSDGNYQIAGLPEGDYKVQFSPSHGTSYLSEWYDDKPDQLTADIVHVTRGETTSGIDATLSSGGTITGTVSNSSGNPIYGVTVCAYPEDFGSSGGCSDTDSQGGYLITSLETGTYNLAFYSNSRDYRDQWYDQRDSSLEADPISVEAHSMVIIDATLESIPHELAANDDQAETSWLTPVVIDVLANDIVDDGVQSVDIVDGPQYGTAAVNPDFTVTYSSGLVYSPSDTLTYRITDLDGDQATARVFINVKLLPIDIEGSPPKQKAAQPDLKSLPPELRMRSGR